MTCTSPDRLHVTDDEPGEQYYSVSTEPWQSCNHLKLSLKARKTRALESINTNLDMLQAVAQEALLIYGKGT